MTDILTKIFSWGRSSWLLFICFYSRWGGFSRSECGPQGWRSYSGWWNDSCNVQPKKSGFIGALPTSSFIYSINIYSALTMWLGALYAGLGEKTKPVSFIEIDVWAKYTEAFHSTVKELDKITRKVSRGSSKVYGNTWRVGKECLHRGCANKEEK